eukprot:2281785-Amphidinium_carterae.1
MPAHTASERANATLPGSHNDQSPAMRLEEPFANSSTEEEFALRSIAPKTAFADHTECRACNAQP